MEFSSLSSIYQDPIGMIHTTLRGQGLILVLQIWFSDFWADKCAHLFFDNFFAETRILQFSSATQNDSKLHRVPNENQGESNRETANPNTGLLHVLHIFFCRFSSVQINLCQKLLFYLGRGSTLSKASRPAQGVQYFYYFETYQN